MMKSEFGTMKRVFCKLFPNQHVTETRFMALEQFAVSLDKDQVHAVHASRTEPVVSTERNGRRGCSSGGGYSSCPTPHRRA